MTLKEIFKNSFDLIRRNKGLLLLFWSTNAAMAVILSLPIYSILIDSLRNSLFNESLPGEISYTWYVQFMRNYEGTISQMPLVIYGVVGIYIIIQTFYFGGMVAVFHNPKKNHISDFFYGGVRYWFRFTKVLLISLALFIFAFKLNDLLGNLFTWILSDYEHYLTDFILRSLRYILLLVFIGVVTIFSDYSKVIIAVDEKDEVFKAIKKSSNFLKNNLRLTSSVFLIIASLGALGAVVYNVIDNFMPRTSYYLLLLSFILQQLLIIFRLAIKMMFCSSEVVIYNDSIAEFVKADIKESTIGVK